MSGVSVFAAPTAGHRPSASPASPATAPETDASRRSPPVRRRLAGPREGRSGRPCRARYACRSGARRMRERIVARVRLPPRRLLATVWTIRTRDTVCERDSRRTVQAREGNEPRWHPSRERRYPGHRRLCRPHVPPTAWPAQWLERRQRTYRSRSRGMGVLCVGGGQAPPWSITGESSATALMFCAFCLRRWRTERSS